MSSSSQVYVKVRLSRKQLDELSKLQKEFKHNKSFFIREASKTFLQNYSSNPSGNLIVPMLGNNLVTIRMPKSLVTQLDEFCVEYNTKLYKPYLTRSIIIRNALVDLVKDLKPSQPFFSVEDKEIEIDNEVIIYA